MMDTHRIGLVLEGGGMRGVFTCGVLDYFMDNDIHFPYAIGVSAGATNGLSYISRQPGRAKFSNIDLVTKYKAFGFNNFIKTGNILNYDLLFDEFPNRIMPYHYDTYFRSPTRFEIVTSNCITGKANYFEEKHDKTRLIEIAKATGSLPFVCPVSYLDGIPMLDGGITDSIPVKRAMSQGFEKNVIVLTQNKGYRKKKMPMKLPPFIYPKYPNIRKAIYERSTLYNAQLDLVDMLEADGKAIVIRPLKPLKVNRAENKTEKLLDLYNEGYECAERINNLKFSL